MYKKLTMPFAISVSRSTSN